LLEHQGTNEADDGRIVREDADDVGAALDLFVDPLERMWARDLGVIAAELSGWREAFLAGGEASLKWAVPQRVV